MDSIDLRDRYPEIERPLRFDGSPKSVKICMEPVIKYAERILNIVDDIAYWKNLEYEDVVVFQSRAMGTCKPTSDIDIYVQLNEKHCELVYDNGVLYKDTGVKLLVGEWAKKFFEDIPPHLKQDLAEMHTDIFWGIDREPPAKYEYRGRKYYHSLKNLEAGI